VPSVFGNAAAATGASLFGGAAPAGRVDLPAPLATATGEEKERTLFSADGVLFEWDAAGRWRERGRGEVRVNVDNSTGQCRVVMRQKGNLRLLLNGNLWPQMQITRLEGGAVSAASGRRACPPALAQLWREEHVVY
jgi:Ran-binding protein 3